MPSWFCKCTLQLASIALPIVSQFNQVKPKKHRKRINEELIAGRAMRAHPENGSFGVEIMMEQLFA